MDPKPLTHFDSLYPAITREKELKKLIPFIENGLSVQLVGLPGSGKSNILRLLSYNKEAKKHNFQEFEKYLHFVYLNSSEVKNRPLFDITKFILINLSFSLGERRMGDESQKINDFLKEALASNDEILLFQSLKKSIDYLSIEKKLTVVLLFDKFESIIPSLTEQFFSNLTSLRNHAKYRFLCIFSVTRLLEELLEPGVLSDFHDLIAENIVYTSLKDEAWLTFRASYIEKAARRSLSRERKDEVITLTGGHSKLSKLAYEALATSEEEEIDNLEEFLGKKSTIQKALSEIWNALLPEEQLALKNNISLNSVKENYPYLFFSQIIDENGVTIPLLSSFIKTVPVNSNDTLSYDEEKNEILMGDVSLSNKLSPSEFKLLKYLIENKGKICSKDEIINSIWGEMKSQEGVTDQALDQIFYRVRKKVEKDPSNPSYIQTIKGMGYKLNG